MPLRAKKPKDIPKRLKLLLFGPAGIGKTTAAIQMPRPYILDGERGTDQDPYAVLINNGDGMVFHVTQMKEVIREVRSLTTEQHEFRTLIIDPITLLYQNLLDEGAAKEGTEFGRHYGYANASMKRLASLIMALDMNVIVTAHAKNVYDGGFQVVGQTFDGWKKLDYLFDLVLELFRHEKGERRARVVKTRLSGFPDGDTFEWSYNAVAQRYGHTEILEKQANVVQLATEEHIVQFNALLVQLDDNEKKRLKIDKALTGVANIADLPDERIVKGIDIMNTYLKGAS